MTQPTVRRFWFEFDLPPWDSGRERPLAILYFGVGVTGFDAADCLWIILDLLPTPSLPPVRSIVPDISLDGFVPPTPSGVGVSVWRGSAGRRSAPCPSPTSTDLPPDRDSERGDYGQIHPPRDCAGNMRSALDHAACELARHHVGKLNDQQEAATEFPICIDEAAFQGWFAKGKKGIRNGLYGDVERKALQCVQPFALRDEARALGVEPSTTSEDDLLTDHAYALNAVWKPRKASPRGVALRRPGDTDLHDRPAGPSPFQGLARGAAHRGHARVGSGGRSLRAAPRRAGWPCGEGGAAALGDAPGPRHGPDQHAEHGDRVRRRPGRGHRVGRLQGGRRRRRRGVGHGQRHRGDPARGEGAVNSAAALWH